MTVITTHLVIAPDGSVAMSEVLPPGDYEAVIIVKDADGDARRALTRDDFPKFDVGPWPDGVSFGRDEIYGDDGR